MAGYPIKRIVIAGCRDYENYEEAETFINKCIADIKFNNTIVIVSGGAKGADKIGELYAKKHGYKTELYPANWIKFGKSAGPKRNKVMAQISDYVICFWDGKSRGTLSMIKFANLYNKPLKIKMI